MVKTLGIEQFAPMNHIYRFYELNDYMKSIAEIGYHSMDLWTCGSHYFVDSNNYEDTKYIKKLMSQYDIRIVSITPRQSCPNPFHMAVKKTELREKAKQYFQNMILAAHELSCPKLLITSGWQSYSETRQEAWDRSVWMVGELCRFAEKYGVSLNFNKIFSWLDDNPQFFRKVSLGSSRFWWGPFLPATVTVLGSIVMAFVLVTIFFGFVAAGVAFLMSLLLSPALMILVEEGVVSLWSKFWMKATPKGVMLAEELLPWERFVTTVDNPETYQFEGRETKRNQILFLSKR